MLDQVRTSKPESGTTGSKIRLCIVNTMYVKDLQNVAGVIFDEAIKLSKDLEEVHVILFHESMKSLRLTRNVFVHTISARSGSGLASLGFSTLLGYLLLIPLIIRIILSHRINLVRADDVLRTGVPAAIACKLMRTPLVTFVAGSGEDILRIKTHANASILKIARLLERMVMLFSDHVFAVTTPLIDRCRAYGARGVTWSATFLDLSNFRPRNESGLPSKLRVLYVGRLEEEKGIRILLESANLLRDEDIEFRIVGDGSLRAQLEDWVRVGGLSTFVRFLGSKPHQEMPEIYNSVDIFALPSYTEGIPVAMLEAIACGKPVIVTSVGIIPEIFKDGIHALIVPPGDAHAIARGIRNLKGNQQLKAQIVRNARQIVHNELSAYVGRHVTAYNAILEHKGAGGSRSSGDLVGKD